ncbi:MAG: aminotransferase class I/II-fold pyridoxal phosphate-dependent enzyme [candidate division Zixibacteria bacterium]|nr:aminotransferase class I/II-fold pyridoxal phosphate-dependent enzyme [candidate division Zixibacteria bacterium]
MSGWETISTSRLEDLAGKVSVQLRIEPERILPFADATAALTCLLQYRADTSTDLLVAGLATPELAIAADRAGIRLAEVVGESPFVSSPNDLVAAVNAGDETIFLANPNQLTGADFARADLVRLAAAVPNGMLIVDETLFDFYGISALPLLTDCTNIVVLRSLTAGFGIRSDESGYLVGSPAVLNVLRHDPAWSTMSNTVYRILSVTMSSGDARDKHVATIRDEALKIATHLTRLGIQNRLTATDFLLMRVADPKQTGNWLARYNVSVENLDGYPQLKSYIRYRIQSPLSNERLLTAFDNMPREYYRLKGLDKRMVKMHRPPQTDPMAERAAETEPATERIAAYVAPDLEESR